VTLAIRRATPADAEVVLGFIRDLARYEREPDAVEATVESLRADLGREPPPFECLVAELDAAPAGFALFFQSYSTWRGRPGIYLEDLFVPERLRGHGVGKALLTEVARLAVARGAGRLEWSVLDWNQPAIDFYLALGAVPMSEWTVYRLTGDALARLGSS
jgi:GNAT superfamily N-acetyltransferase